MRRPAMRRFALLLFAAALAGPALAQGGDLTAKVTAYVEEQAAGASTEDKAAIVACYVKTLDALSADEKAALLGAASFSDGLDTLTGAKPDLGPVLQSCMG